MTSWVDEWIELLLGVGVPGFKPGRPIPLSAHLGFGSFAGVAPHFALLFGLSDHQAQNLSEPAIHKLSSWPLS